MRLFAPSFPVLAFILAFVFISQASESQASSNSIRRSSRKTKLRRDLERIAGLFENGYQDNGWSEWVDDFRSFWEDFYEAEPTSHPIPSPSESPIPEGAGQFPETVESKKSKEGFNQGSYEAFVLNQPFYLDLEEEASAESYEKNKAELHILMKQAERGSLTQDGLDKWKNVTAAILESYSNEKGAIVFDISFSQLWMYCGWVEMTKTFVLTKKYMRICASLISLGMNDITRPPEEGKDFIVPGETDPGEIQNMLEPILNILSRQSLSTNIRSEPVTVDLFDYPEYCKLQTKPLLSELLRSTECGLSGDANRSAVKQRGESSKLIILERHIMPFSFSSCLLRVSNCV